MNHNTTGIIKVSSQRKFMKHLDRGNQWNTLSNRIDIRTIALIIILLVIWEPWAWYIIKILY